MTASIGTGTRHLSPHAGGEPAITGTAAITRTNPTTPGSWPRARLVAAVVLVVAAATGIGLFLAGRRPPERVEEEVVAPAAGGSATPAPASEAAPAPISVPPPPTTTTTETERRPEARKKHKKPLGVRPPGHEPNNDSDKGSEKLIDLAGDRQ